MTTTKSPASRCGVKTGLFLPRRISATCAARRPSTAPLASMTCHLRWSRFTFGKYVFISSPNQKRGQTTKANYEVNSFHTAFSLAARRRAGPGDRLDAWEQNNREGCVEPETKKLLNRSESS